MKFLLPAFLSFFILVPFAHAAISFEPAAPIQGQAVLMTISSSSKAQSATFDGKTVPLFVFQGKTRAFLPLDINRSVGTYPFTVKYADGSVEKTDVPVGARERIEIPLGIPEKLGGNTTSSAQKLVSTLAAENATFLNLRMFPKLLWSLPFRAPLNTALVITDTYGYNRDTVGQTITHKGLDFRAEQNTRVRAMNRGIVRIARTYRNYGKTVVIDHGDGVQTMYMHMSKISVRVGELVGRGQIIGLSGMTGYAESPHLHVSVRINEISIDPEEFLRLFGTKDIPHAI